MTPIEVRRAGIGDLDAVAISSAALFAEDSASRDQLRNQQWPASYGREWCAELLGKQDALVLVATSQDAVVGHLVGQLMTQSAMWSGSRAELVSMRVETDLRGQGVGGRLVDEFRAWAQRHHAERLQVTAYATNENALRFYARHGFTPLSIELAAGTR